MNAVVTLCPGLGLNNPHVNRLQMGEKKKSFQWSMCSDAPQ